MALFITFEGGDGSGTSTQAELLHARLQKEGIRAILTREPGGTGIHLAEEIRGMLLSRQHQDMEAVTEAFLYFAGRAQHVGRLIRPALERGVTVVSDRFNDSTLAYQGYGRGLDLIALREMARFATGGLTPDITFLLDIAPEIGLARKNSHALDRLEAADLEFHRRVRQGFRILACGNPRIVVLDAERPIAEIAERVWEKVQQLLIKEK